MIIDVVHVESDCRVFGRTRHRLLDDVRASASGHRDIALGQNHDRDFRTLTQTSRLSRTINTRVPVMFGRSCDFAVEP
jgi:hypothetical protein